MKSIITLLSLLCAMPLWAADTYTWEKATSLADGDIVVLVAANVKREFNGINTEKKYGVASEFDSETAIGKYPLLVVKDENGYRFQSSKNSANYLTSVSENPDLIWGDNKLFSYWDVTFTNGIAQIRNVAQTSRYIKYDSTYNYFKSFSNTAGYLDVCLYKRITHSSSKIGRDLKFSNASYTINLYNKAFFVPPTLSGETEDVCYSSSETEVATVDETSGAIEIKSVGTTTITASAPETEIYDGATTSYTIKVIDYTLFNFTAAASIEAMGYPSSGNDPYVSSIYRDEVKIQGTGNDRTIIYLDAPSLRLYKNGGQITISVPEQYELNQLIITGDGLKKANPTLSHESNISDTQIEWTGASPNYTIQSNAESVVVHYIKVYYRERTQRPTSKQITIGALGTTTFSSFYSWQLPQGLTASTATLQDESTIQLHDVFQAHETLPAQTGLIIKGEAGTYELTQPTDEEIPTSKLTGNLLKPVLTHQTITAQDEHKMFILANDSKEGLGFYYQGAEGKGTSVSRINGKAYLEVPVSEAAKSYKIDLNPTADIGTYNVNTAEKHLGVYDLSGKKVLQKAPLKGIYIVNRKKFLFK